MIAALARKLFGSSNDRRIKGYGSKVSAINALEPELEKLSDEALRARTDEFKKQLAEGDNVIRRLSRIAIAARPLSEPEAEPVMAPRLSSAKAVAAAAHAFSERRRSDGLAA